MVLDLLLLSRADAGKLDSERGPVDVQRLVSEVTRDYRIVAESKGIRFTLTNESTPSVIGDRRQLERILVNLLDNAIKYTTPGGSVRVELLYRKPSVEIQVLDTGCGISNEQLPRIFERFYQVNKAIAGVGLGLSIARTLAVQNGAELTVVSRPGEGSKFVLRLPAASDES
jgi:signal transduction histidine kinase